MLSSSEMNRPCIDCRFSRTFGRISAILPTKLEYSAVLSLYPTGMRNGLFIFDMGEEKECKKRPELSLTALRQIQNLTIKRSCC